MTIQQNTPQGVTATAASEVSSADFEAYTASEAALPSLDAVLANSPMMAALRKMSGSTGAVEQESLPEEDDESDPAQVDPQEQPDAGEATEDDAEEGNEEESEEETEEGDDASTAAESLTKEEDVDWTFKIPVKVDGKVEHVTLEQLRKGYATDQSLSQKGRELGEAKKQTEAERATKLAEVIQLTEVISNELLEKESVIGAQFVELKKQHDAAKKEGNTYAARELKEKMDDLKEEFGQVQSARVEKIKRVAAAYQKKAADERKELAEKYSKEAPELIQGYSDEVAVKCRDFAIEQGLPADLLEGIYDARVVKFINDFRLLKENLGKGATKRKVAAEKQTSKQIPLRKGTPQPAKAEKVRQVNRAKVLSGNGDTQDQLDFLKNISSISQKLK